MKNQPTNYEWRGETDKFSITGWTHQIIAVHFLQQLHKWQPDCGATGCRTCFSYKQSDKKWRRGAETLGSGTPNRNRKLHLDSRLPVRSRWSEPIRTHQHTWSWSVRFRSDGFQARQFVLRMFDSSSGTGTSLSLARLQWAEPVLWLVGWRLKSFPPTETFGGLFSGFWIRTFLNPDVLIMTGFLLLSVSKCFHVGFISGSSDQEGNQGFMLEMFY